VSTQLFVRANGFPETNMHAKGLENDPGWTDPNYNIYSQGGMWLSTARGPAADTFQWAGLTPTGPSTYWGALDSAMTYPIQSDFTLSGTVTFNIRASISADGNFGLRAYVYRYRASDGTLTAIVNGSNKGTELTTSQVANNWTASPTSTTIQKGDCLVLMLAGVDTAGTMVSGLTPLIYLDGPTAGASGDSWVQFTENFAVAAPTLGGTKLYLSDVASDITPPAGYTSKKLLLGTRDDGQVTATLEGTSLASGTDWTITAGGNKIEWLTDPIGPVTLEDGLRAQFSGSVAGFGGTIVCSQAILERVDADGVSNPVTLAKFVPTRGTGSSRQMEWQDQNSDIAYDATVGIYPLAFVNHRLRLRVKAVAGYAYPSAHPMPGGNGNDPNFKYGATGTGVGDAWVELAQSVSAYTAPGPVTNAYTIQPARVY